MVLEKVIRLSIVGRCLISLSTLGCCSSRLNLSVCIAITSFLFHGYLPNLVELNSGKACFKVAIPRKMYFVKMDVFKVVVLLSQKM